MERLYVLRLAPLPIVHHHQSRTVDHCQLLKKCEAAYITSTYHQRHQHNRYVALAEFFQIYLMITCTETIGVTNMFFALMS